MRKIGLTAAVALLIAAPAFAQDALDGLVSAGQAPVPLDGREIAIPVPPDADAGDLRVVISGSVACSLNGRSYDASSEVVRWSPGSLRMAEQDAGAQRYVLRPETGSTPPASVSAWVDTDRLVRELIVTPSEVRDSLSGDLRLELWRAPKDNGLAGMLLPVGAALAVIIVLAVVTARRSHSMSDVQEALGRIDRKHAAVKRAARKRTWDSRDLEHTLDELQASARHLADEIGRFRRTAASIDLNRLERELTDDMRRLDAAEREDVRAELQALFDARRKLWEMLQHTGATVERHLLRLAQIEAALDTLVVQMAEQDGRMAATDADREAIDALQRELTATDAAINELKLIDSPGAFMPGV